MQSRPGTLEDAGLPAKMKMTDSQGLPPEAGLEADKVLREGVTLAPGTRRDLDEIVIINSNCCNVCSQ